MNRNFIVYDSTTGDMKYKVRGDLVPDVEVDQGIIEVSETAYLAGSLPLAEIQDLQWERVKTIRDTIDKSNLAVPGVGSIQLDPTSRDKLDTIVIQALIATVANTPFQVDFTLADNTPVTFTKSDILGLYSVLTTRLLTTHNVSQALRTQIYDAMTPSEVLALPIESNWPS